MQGKRHLFPDKKGNSFQYCTINLPIEGNVVILTWNNMFIEYQPEIKEKKEREKERNPINTCIVYCIVFDVSKSCTPPISLTRFLMQMAKRLMEEAAGMGGREGRGRKVVLNVAHMTI